jgi:hypothetical protein
MAWIIDDTQLGGKYRTTLDAAYAHGKIEVLKALLRVGASRNVDGECLMLMTGIIDDM